MRNPRISSTGNPYLNPDIGCNKRACALQRQHRRMQETSSRARTWGPRDLATKPHLPFNPAAPHECLQRRRHNGEQEPGIPTVWHPNSIPDLPQQRFMSACKGLLERSNRMRGTATSMLFAPLLSCAQLRPPP